MDLKIHWHKPQHLIDGSKDQLIYNIREWDVIPDAPGIYIFARLYGDAIEPIYVGKAERLNVRIWGQLNYVRLMRGIEHSKNGNKILLLGEFIPKSGQNVKKALRIIENSVIKYFLAEGYELWNSQGTKTPVDTLLLEGNRRATRLFPSNMTIPKK